MNEDCEKHTVDESFKHSLILTINGHKYEWNRQYIKGFEIRKLGNIKSEDDIFLSIVHPWQDELIQDDEEVDLARPEIEHFFSKEKHKKNYVIIIDRRNYTVEKECMSGREILALAGKQPAERFLLDERFNGGKSEHIQYDQVVCFSKPGIEKFVTLPKDQIDGE